MQKKHLKKMKKNSWVVKSELNLPTKTKKDMKITMSKIFKFSGGRYRDNNYRSRGDNGYRRNSR